MGSAASLEPVEANRVVSGMRRRTGSGRSLPHEKVINWTATFTQGKVTGSFTDTLGFKGDDALDGPHRPLCAAHEPQIAARHAGIAGPRAAGAW